MSRIMANFSGNLDDDSAVYSVHGLCICSQRPSNVHSSQCRLTLSRKVNCIGRENEGLEFDLLETVLPDREVSYKRILDVVIGIPINETHE